METSLDIKNPTTANLLPSSVFEDNHDWTPKEQAVLNQSLTIDELIELLQKAKESAYKLEIEGYDSENCAPRVAFWVKGELMNITRIANVITMACHDDDVHVHPLLEITF